MTVTITAVLPAPQPSSATVAANSTINTIPLTITGGTATSLAISTQAAHGAATVSGTSINYAPTAGYSGPDSFQYTATDTAGTSTAATVTITVTPPPIPTVTGVVPVQGSTAGGTSVTLTGTNFTGATAVSFGGTAATSFSVTNSTSITVVTPAVGSAGTVDITVTAPGGTSATSASDHFNYVAPPVALSFTFGSTVTYNTGGASATSIDVSGHATNSPTSYNVGSATTSGGGSVSITNAGVASYTPLAGFRGNDTFTFTATNGGGTSSPATVTVSVGDPTISVTPTTLPGGTAETAYNHSLTPSGGKAPYTLSLASGALPAGLSLASNGAITGTPTAAGTFTFTVSGADSSTGTGPVSFTSTTISLTIAAPTISVGPVSLPTPVIGTAYSQTVSGSGGNGSYTFTVSSGALPTGLSLAGGTISGTPTAAGAYNFTITATDGNSFTGNRTYSGTIAAPTLAIAPASTGSLSGTAETAYSQAFTASGGSGTYSYAFAITGGTLPTGLSFSGGTLSGTPTTAGSASFTVTATDTVATGSGSPYTVTGTYTLTVAAPTISVGPVSLPTPVIGTAYGNHAVTASGGNGSYTFAVSSGALPAGLSLAGGTISGAPTAAGSYSFVITATDGNSFTGSRTYSGTIAAPTLAIAPASTGSLSGTAETAYSQAFTASGGTGPYTYVFAITGGTLPTGLSFSGGTLSGTPTAAGSASFTVTATDTVTTGSGSPYTVTGTYTLTIAAPTVAVGPTTLPTPVIGTAYGNQVLSASGGNGSYTFAVTAGSLPAGLSLSSGTISGTPTGAGAYSFTITATDGNSFTGSRVYSGTIAAPTITIGPATLPGGVNGTSYSQTVTATGGTAPYTYSVSSGSLPTNVTLNASTGVISGTPNAVSTYNFTIKAIDSTTGSGAPYFGTQAYSITTTPVLPTAGAVSATVAYNSSANPITLNLGGGAAASVAVASAASHGTATASGTSITYTPTPGYSGSDSFTYTATNATGTSSPATVSITVNPQAPTAGAVSATVAYNSSANSITLNLGGGAAASVAVASAASHGTATVGTGNSITYTPTTGFFGSDSFTYTATNVTSTSAPGTVTITVSPPPIAVTPTTLAAGVLGTAYSQSLSASGGQAPYSFSTAVASGALPGGLSLSSSGAITGTPTATGSFTFTVSGTDSSTASHASFTSATISLTINNAAPPTLSSLSATSGSTAGGTSVTITGTNFVGTPTVSFGGTAASSVVLVNATTITAVSPAHAAGVVDVTVTAAGGTTSASAADRFTYIAPPTAGAVSQSVVGNSSGNAITLNLGGGTATSVAVASAASHGNAAASGTSITYTPTIGYAGPDSFTYTATNTSGTSSAGTVSITVTAPILVLAPATLPAGTVEAAYSQALTASGGTAPYTYTVTSGSLPAGLTLSTTGTLSGTPTAGGSFPVTLKATDSTGFSVSKAYTLAIGAATVSLTPSTLPPPQVNVAYSQTLVAGGGVAPYHYTVTSGQLPPGLSLNAATGVLAGTPTQAGSYNATIQATDSSSGSGPYHASINFQLPTTQQVPVAAAVTSTTPANIRDAINVGASVTGPINSVAVASNPAHGTAVPSGVNIVYTPATNFFGTDSFTYTATGPGGTSAPATVTVTVTPLAVPVAQPLTAQVLTNAPVTLNATASASNGPFTAVAIATPPSTGTAVVNGQNIVYTPVPGQTVTANITFTYTVANVYGASAPATVTITVNPVPVPPPTQTIVTPPPSPTSDGTATADITSNAAGGPFVSASLINVTPPNAGTVTLVPITGQTGSIAPTHVFAELLGIKPAVADTVTVSGHAFKVVFKPNPGFVGTVTITYSLANAFAASLPGELLFVVPPRADISADADVAGLVAAQIEEARRFATAQIGNFNQRLEALHGDGPARSSNGLSVNFGDQTTTAAQSDPDENPLTRGTMDVHRLSRNDARGGQDQNTASGQQGAKRQDGGDGESILPANLAFWTAGSVDFGARSSVAQRSGFNFTTDGVSAGADYRLDQHFTIGLGGGYGHDESDISSDGTKSIADSYSAAIYGSYHPSTDTFLDGVLGYGTLSYDSTRLITTTTDYAHGHRGGEQSFGSLTGGYEYKTDTIRLTPYGRFDYSDSTLDRFSETAPGRAALTYFAQSQTTLTATLGFKGDLAIPLDWGMFLPFLRAELEHDFQAASRAGLAYADLASAGPAYFLPGDPVDRNHMQLGIGANLKVGNFTFGLAYENSFGIHQEQDSQIRLLVTAHF